MIGLAETLGYIIADLLISKYKRKPMILLITGVLVVICFSFIFLKTPEDCIDQCFVKIFQIGFTSFSRLLICIGWAFIFVFICEMYPTVVRSMAIGSISAAGTLGSILSPFLVTFSNKMKISPMICFGLISVVSFFCTLPLKETFNRPIKQNIKEEELLKSELNSFGND